MRLNIDPKCPVLTVLSIGSSQKSSLASLKFTLKYRVSLILIENYGRDQSCGHHKRRCDTQCGAPDDIKTGQCWSRTSRPVFVCVVAPPCGPPGSVCGFQGLASHKLRTSSGVQNRPQPTPTHIYILVCQLACHTHIHT